MAQHPVRIVPDLSCAMCYGKNVRYLPADEVAENEKLRKEREKNSEFYQTYSSSSVKSFRSYKPLAFRVLLNLKYGE